VVAHVLTLIGKPGCHLCDDARTTIHSVIDDLGDARVDVEERSILEEPALFDRYAEEIPVVLVDGKVHTYWRVDPTRLRSALLQ
jgi:hypothetical protein